MTLREYSWLIARVGSFWAKQDWADLFELLYRKFEPDDYLKLEQAIGRSSMQVMEVRGRTLLPDHSTPPDAWQPSFRLENLIVGLTNVLAPSVELPPRQ
jgi:hypothetical protein